MRMPIPRILLAGVLGGVLVCAAAACQEQIVREEYVPSTGMGPDTPYAHASPHLPPPRVATQPDRRDFFDKLGDFMFGWTDERDDPEPDSAPSNAPLWQRYE